MFYKAIGYATWTGAKWYVKRRVAGYMKIGAGLAIVTIAATAYLAARSNGEDDDSE
jgi:hypothetical protein